MHMNMIYKKNLPSKGGVYEMSNGCSAVSVENRSEYTCFFNTQTVSNDIETNIYSWLFYF